MSEPTFSQGILFPLPPEQESPQKRRWYYVKNPRGTHVLVQMENKDKLVWVENELQHVVPYLWNHAGTAHKDLKRMNIKGTVVLYPFTTPWWETRGVIANG